MRWAVLASVVVHVGVAWLLVGQRAPQPPPEVVPDVVQVSFEVEEVGGEPAGSGAKGESRAVAEPTHAAATKGRVTTGRVGEHAATAANEGRRAELPSPGGSAGGTVDRLSTFRPAHPDLRGPVRLPPPAEKPRDLLASPLAKGKVAPRELPRVLRGSGGVTARVSEDGSIHFADPKDLSLDDPRLAEAGESPGLSGRFDITDQVMKLAGQDPYASAKRALADETREQRLCMARRYQGERQRQELFHLGNKIRRLAARTDLSETARRALIFDIWDECLEEAETGPNYGAMARATILAVVREVFPAGTERAYQPAELLALNHRRSSRQRFAPYDPVGAIGGRLGRQPDAGAPAECPVQ